MHLFAYGSLMHMPILLEVAGVATARSAPASLADYRRGRIEEETFPGILPEAGEQVPGTLYYELPPAAWLRLDRFEGDLYIRTSVNVTLPSGAPLAAETYVLRPAYASLLLNTPWDLADFLPQWQSWLAARMDF